MSSVRGSPARAGSHCLRAAEEHEPLQVRAIPADHRQEVLRPSDVHADVFLGGRGFREAGGMDHHVLALDKAGERWDRIKAAENKPDREG